MASAIHLPGRIFRSHLGSSMAATLVRPLEALVAAPSLLFLATMAVMLFRPPDLKFFALDRVLFALLVAVVFLRMCVLRLPLQIPSAVTWPMLGLAVLGFFSLFGEPFEIENWSVFAAKWVVPLTFYVLAGYIFEDATALRRFETFALLVLGYLTFTAVMWAAGVTSLVFPRWILDESIGIHADRARGPFLQAVANGVTLNLLGLIAVNAWRRRRLRGPFAWLLMAALPVAIVATKTRAVWLAFAASILLVFFLRKRSSLLRVCAWAIFLSITTAMTVTALAHDSVADRLQDRSPVEYRMAVYDAGWHMFAERPLFGWPARSIQPELSNRISGFKVDAVYLHDTYLEIAVQHGLLGLGLYVWIIAGLFRLGRRSGSVGTVFGDEFRPLWRLMVLVYLVNASFVVMNYQFVNGLLFTMAGLLAAQQRRAERNGDR